MKPLLIAATLAFTIVAFGSAAEKKTETFTVKLFEHEGFEGVSLSVPLTGPECYNLPTLWDNEASSVDPGTACVELFDLRDCVGTGVRVDSRDVRRALQLSARPWNLNDKLSALRLCPSPTPTQ